MSVKILLNKHTDAQYQTFVSYNNIRTKKKKTHFNTSSKIEKINTNIKENDIVYIIDINNDTNKIEGIHIIRNKKIRKLYKASIYSSCEGTRCERNRYSYFSPFYISRQRLMNINDKSKLCILWLEYCIFYGRKNFKRMENIVVPFDIKSIIKDNNGDDTLYNYYIRYLIHLKIYMKQKQTKIIVRENN